MDKPIEIHVECYREAVFPNLSAAAGVLENSMQKKIVKLLADMHRGSRGRLPIPYGSAGSVSDAGWEF